MKHKHKLGNTLEGSNKEFGKVTEIRLTEGNVVYVLNNNESLNEADVTAVYRAVVPRAPKTQTKSKKKSARNEESRASA